MALQNEMHEFVRGPDFQLPVINLVLDNDHRQQAPINELKMSGSAILFAEQQGKTDKMFSSRIFRGGIHLRRIVPYKDVLVPSGPLSSLFGTMFNLSNSTIGAGVLGFGVVFAKLGIVLAPFVALLVLILQCTANSFMLRAAEKSGARSLSVLAYHNFGLLGSVCLDVTMIISCFGSLCAYFVILADFMLPVAAEFLSPSSLLARDRVVAMLFVGLIGVLPLSLKRSVNSLEVFSVLSICIIGLVMIGVVALSAIQISSGRAPTSLTLARLDVTSIGALSVMFFAFSNTSSVFPIFVEMKIPTRFNFNRVQILAGAFVFVVYIMVGAMTYAAYGESVPGNLLNVFPVTPITTLMRLGFGCSVLTTYPLVLFPLRLAIEHLLFGIKRQFSPLEFSTVTVLVVGASFGVASATSNVDIVFGLTGAIGFSLMSFVFPGLIMIKAYGVGRNPEGRIIWTGFYLFSCSVLMTLFGIGALVAGVISWVSTL